VYQHNDADGWSQELADEHLERLADYRDGEKTEPAEGEPSTDRLTFVAGEPPDRFVTRIGGVPYRPASLPWPTRKDGRPMTFFAQICFADSADLVSAADDVLLIFATEEDGHLSGLQSHEPGLHFEWYPLGIKKLIQPKQVPPTAWKLLPCFGRLERLSEADGPIEGAKIGGSQFVIQHEHDDTDDFLAALGQVRLSATAKQSKAGYAYLQMADDGLLNFFDNLGGYIVWDLQSY
jgi:hypothetical protein